MADTATVTFTYRFGDLTLTITSDGNEAALSIDGRCPTHHLVAFFDEMANRIEGDDVVKLCHPDGIIRKEP